MTDRSKGGTGGARASGKGGPRRWTFHKRRMFLNFLAQSCNVSAAARLAEVDRNSAYDLKDRDPAFARAWREALNRAHGDLELHLIASARDGSVRTEAVIDGQTGKARQIKLVHSYPLTIALRLYLSHRGEVEAFRQASEAQGTEEEIDAHLAARMNAVRARLGGGADGIPEEGGPEEVQEDDAPEESES